MVTHDRLLFKPIPNNFYRQFSHVLNLLLKSMCFLFNIDFDQVMNSVYNFLGFCESRVFRTDEIKGVNYRP